MSTLRGFCHYFLCHYVLRVGGSHREMTNVIPSFCRFFWSLPSSLSTILCYSIKKKLFKSCKRVICYFNNYEFCLFVMMADVRTTFRTTVNCCGRCWNLETELKLIYIYRRFYRLHLSYYKCIKYEGVLCKYMLYEFFNS